MGWCNFWTLLNFPLTISKIMSIKLNLQLLASKTPTGDEILKSILHINQYTLILYVLLLKYILLACGLIRSYHNLRFLSNLNCYLLLHQRVSVCMQYVLYSWIFSIRCQCLYIYICVLYYMRCHRIILSKFVIRTTYKYTQINFGRSKIQILDTQRWRQMHREISYHHL